MPAETILPGVSEALRAVPRRGAGAARTANECAPVTTTARKPGNARRPIRRSSRRCCWEERPQLALSRAIKALLLTVLQSPKSIYAQAQR